MITPLETHDMADILPSRIYLQQLERGRQLCIVGHGGCGSRDEVTGLA